jgi:hypothetical protein
VLWRRARRRPLRRIDPADSGHRRRRDAVHLIRRSTALQIFRADLCFAASPTRPHRLCSPTVACCGELIAADASGALDSALASPPWCGCCHGAAMALLGLAPLRSGVRRRGRACLLVHGKCATPLLLLALLPLFLLLAWSLACLYSQRCGRAVMLLCLL